MTLSCLGSDVGEVIIVDVICPFSIKFQEFVITMRIGLILDVVGYEESGEGEIKPCPSFSSSGFEYPMIGVETG
jgi:hypothetical protein